MQRTEAHGAFAVGVVLFALLFHTELLVAAPDLWLSRALCTFRVLLGSTHQTKLADATSVFVTGGTGFLGSFIVAEVMARAPQAGP